MSDILIVPNPILRKVSKPVEKLDKSALKIIKEVQATLTKDRKPRGVGLSAVQIGKPIRVFSTYIPKSGSFKNNEKLVLNTYINPKIVKSSKKLTLGKDKKKPFLEGCLSIPGIWGPVPRYQWIKLSYFTLDKKTLELIEHSNRFSDFPARLIQHELDHLNGILFTDYSLKHKLPLYEDQNGKLQEISLVT